jgi:hypothetical protein
MSSKLLSHGVQEQIAVRGAHDLDPVGVQSQLRRNPHCLAVAIYEDAGGQRGHGYPRYTYAFACMLIGRSGSRNDAKTQIQGVPDQGGPRIEPHL